MDLDVAAPETLNRVKALDTELDEARQALRSAQEKLEQAAEQLDSDDRRFAEAVEQLDNDVQEQRELLGRQAGETLEALGALAEKLRGAHQQCEDELSGAEEGMAALEERIHGLEPGVEDVFQQVVRASEAAEAALAEVQEQVKEAVSQTGAVAARAARDLRGFGEVVDSRVDNLEAYVTEMCVPVLEDIADTWGRTVRGVVTAAVSAGAAAAQQNLPLVLGGVAEKCRGEHTAALDELAELGRRLEGVVQALGEATETNGSEMMGLSETEVLAARESETGLEGLLAALLRAKEQLASYTFVQL